MSQQTFGKKIQKKKQEEKIIQLFIKQKNNETGKCVAIKEINNQKYRIKIKELKKEIEEMKKINFR